MNVKPLIGLGGMLLATTAGDLNDYLGSTALVDIRGSLQVGFDAATWIDSLYLAAQPVGMLISAWIMITFSLRRWAIFVIGLVGVTSALLPLSPNLAVFCTLRLTQGLAGGLITPLLMDTALFVLPPPVRLYGLAVYALTATFVPALASTIAALWLDVLNWPFVFYQAIPLCALGAALVWYGLPQEPPIYERLRLFDWRALLLVIVGVGSLNTMLYQGTRLDWFDSKAICVLALLSCVSLPMLLINEWFHPLPFLKLQMLNRRNFAYGILALFLFIIVGQGSSTVPLTFLEEVQGLRPIQANLITLEIAALQLVMLPLMAFVLNFRQVDCRVVSLVGLLFLIASFTGSSFLTVYWDRQQFYVWQALSAAGQAMVVMPILQLSTNAVRTREEAPWASAMINFPRSIAEVVAVWLIDTVHQRRGSLHYNRLVDQVGLDRWRVIQGEGVLPQHPPPLLADGRPRFPTAMTDFVAALQRQADILTTSDAFLVFAALAIVLFLIVLVLPVRTLPPRLEAADI